MDLLLELLLVLLLLPLLNVLITSLLLRAPLYLLYNLHDKIHTVAAEAAAPATYPWIHGFIYFIMNHIFNYKMKNSHGLLNGRVRSTWILQVQTKFVCSCVYNCWVLWQEWVATAYTSYWWHPFVGCALSAWSAFFSNHWPLSILASHISRVSYDLFVIYQGFLCIWGSYMLKVLIVWGHCI